jgi:hypothetical protein
VRSNRGQKHGMPRSHDPADETRQVQLPDEVGPVPVSIMNAEPTWFGVPPPLMLLGVTAGCFLIAIVLFATGRWPFGLILLGLAALACAAFLEIAKRRPDSTLTREALAAALRTKSWASNRLELARARSSAVAEAQRVRGARAVIESDRRQALLHLGEAVHSEDDAAEAMARERLSELKRAEEALAGRVEARQAEADERVRRVRMAAEPTLVVPPDTDRPAA